MAPTEIRSAPKLIHFTPTERRALNIVAKTRQISSSELVRICLDSCGIFNPEFIEQCEELLSKREKSKV